MMYELRRTVVRRNAFEDYRRLVVERLMPALTERGASPLCLLNGIVGAPPEETYLIVGYRDGAEWERLQWKGRVLAGSEAAPWAGLEGVLEERRALVVEESVKLMRQSPTRPKQPFDPADRRPLYGLRRFLIRSEDWPEFCRSSETLWQHWEPALDSPILGMFRDAAVADPLPVTLLTGYRSAAHWEQTRDLFRGGTAERPAGLSPEVWSDVIRDYRIRNIELPLTAYVCHMRAHWPVG